MYVGNIITSLPIEEEDFNICNELDIIDDSLPTLIIGWENAKNLFKNKVSILHKQIDVNFYWTFSEKERKIDYEDDIKEFKKLCYNIFGEDIIYVHIDPLHTKLRIIKKILSKIISLNEVIFYKSEKNMLYILGDNLIFGVDLNITEYIGVDTLKIISRLESLPNSTLIENEIFNKCKEFVKK